MLTFDSPLWSELTHAYGSADDIPELLSRASSGDGSAIDELFGFICHQGSVYSASFAAVPHLVEIAGRTGEPDLRARMLILVGSIASSSDNRSGARVPPEIEAEYQAVLPEALKLAIRTLGEALEPHVAVYLLEAAAGLEGYTALGRILSGFSDEEFTLTCPGCACELYVWPTAAGLSTTSEDPVKSPNTTRTPIVPGPPPGTQSEAQYLWLLRVGGEAALSMIACRLPYLFGSGVCPSCRERFSLIDELAVHTA